MLSNRGPDYYGQVCRELPFENGDSTVHLNFTSTVLALRGDHVAKQPLESSPNGSILCWNGEAWKMNGQPISGKNDAEFILAKLDSYSSDLEARQSYILNTLRQIDGPFAFVFYDAYSKSIFFARDRLGRRSLLFNLSEDGNSISFSSIADPATDWKEVQADAIYSINLNTHLATPKAFKLDTCFIKHDWVLFASDHMVSTVTRNMKVCVQYSYKLIFTGFGDR